MNRLYGLAALVAACLPLSASDGEFHIASVGDLRLERGDVIRDCRIGYRTFGRLDNQRSNVVLFPTWLAGTTQLLAPMIGPGKLVDSSRFYVVAVEAIGNGISSSPSNSRSQPNANFPHFTIRDMVASQYKLLTQVLNIKHIKAVLGLSMGGIQTFQWMVDFPDFMDKAAPIIGTPVMTSYDLLLWKAERMAMAHYLATPGCAPSPREVMRTVAIIHALAAETPQRWVRTVAPSEFPKTVETTEKPVLANWNIFNYDRQLEAMMGHDITRRFGGSLDATVSEVKARVMVVVADQDHMVNPGPAMTFAALLKAPVTHLDSDCGHVSFSCDSATLISVVDKFLKE
jgi:homoserine O-acetyltransferase